MSRDRRYKILLVEDDAADRAAFMGFVAENDSLCTADNAVSIAEAKVRLEAKHYDIVIADHHLGDGTALDLIPLVKDAPVIFAACSGNEEAAVAALKAGAYDYMVKDRERNHLKVLMMTIVRSMKRWRAEKKVRLLAEAFKGISDAAFVTDADGWIVFSNEAFSRIYGYSSTEAAREKGAVLWGDGGNPSGTFSKRPATHRRKDGRPFPVEHSASVMPGRDGRAPVTVHVVGDLTEKKRAEAERERLIAELRDALAQVKRLSGLLPICASCKQVRDGQGGWSPIESYITGHSEANFTHGVCPDCAHKLYPEYADELEAMEKGKW